MEDADDGGVAGFLRELEQFGSFRTLAPVILALCLVLLVEFSIRRLIHLLDKISTMGRRILHYFIAALVLIIACDILYHTLPLAWSWLYATDWIAIAAPATPGYLEEARREFFASIAPSSFWTWWFSTPVEQ